MWLGLRNLISCQHSVRRSIRHTHMLVTRVLRLCHAIWANIRQLIAPIPHQHVNDPAINASGTCVNEPAIYLRRQRVQGNMQVQKSMTPAASDVQKLHERCGALQKEAQ